MHGTEVVGQILNQYFPSIGKKDSVVGEFRTGESLKKIFLKGGVGYLEQNITCRSNSVGHAALFEGMDRRCFRLGSVEAKTSPIHSL